MGLDWGKWLTPRPRPKMLSGVATSRRDLGSHERRGDAVNCRAEGRLLRPTRSGVLRASTRGRGTHPRDRRRNPGRAPWGRGRGRFASGSLACGRIAANVPASVIRVRTALIMSASLAAWRRPGPARGRQCACHARQDTRAANPGFNGLRVRIEAHLAAGKAPPDGAPARPGLRRGAAAQAVLSRGRMRRAFSRSMPLSSSAENAFLRPST